MQAFSETLRALRLAEGLTQVEVAALISRRAKPISSRVVSKWEKGEISPGIRQFLLLCELYGVEDIPATFLGDAQAAPRLNAAGRQKLREYEQLLLGCADYTVQPPAVKAGRLLRFYDVAVSAGTGQYIEDAAFALREVGDEVPAEADYGVRIAGDSMEPRFWDGQWIYVQSGGAPLQEGDTGIFLYEGECYCKVLGSEGGRPVLRSLNPAYAPIPVQNPEALYVQGRVVE